MLTRAAFATATSAADHMKNRTSKSSSAVAKPSVSHYDNKTTTNNATSSKDSKLDSKVDGAEIQIVTIQLHPNQKVQAFPGCMLYMTEGVSFSTKTGGGGMGWRRLVTGSPMFYSEFQYSGGSQGTVAFGSKFPSKVVEIDLSRHGNKIICQKGSFLCAEDNIKIHVEYAPTWGTKLFGGEGFILQGMSGPGTAWVSGCGAIVEKKLKAGETWRCETGAVMAFEKTVKYDIERVRGGRNVMFGREGLFLTTMTGPGTIWIESASVSGMVEEIANRIDRN